jgi:peroxiredoxin
MRLMMCSVLLVLSVASVSWAQSPGGDSEPGKNPPQSTVSNPSETAPEPVGLEQGLGSEVVIGRKAPNFELEDSRGGRVRLSDLNGQWAVMVFVESHATLGSLKGIDGDLHKLGARLLGICQERATTLKSYAEREQLPFVILSDRPGDTFRIYGMYNAENAAVQPGVVVLDPKGVVRLSVLGPSLHPDEVLQLAKHVVSGS